jgi:hypothetical protein
MGPIDRIVPNSELQKQDMAGYINSTQSKTSAGVKANISKCHIHVTLASI